MVKEQENVKYQWDASDYANHSNAQQIWAKELISKFNLKGHESLLDIGCGDGKVTAEIASYLKEGRVVGIDNSEEMISLAKGKFPSSNYPNLSFYTQDVRIMSFQQEFDVVFSNAVLHWVINHRPVLKWIFHALKGNGKRRPLGIPALEDKTARPGLCGGCWVTGIPTTTIEMKLGIDSADSK